MLCNDDWRAVIHGANLLLEGEPAQTERYVRALIQHLRAPVHVFPLCSSAPIPGPATLLVENVDRLGIDDQRRLFAALEQPGLRVQVIAVSATPLVERVEAGEFLSDLYYRLNVVRVVLDAEGLPC